MKTPMLLAVACATGALTVMVARVVVDRQFALPPEEFDMHPVSCGPDGCPDGRNALTPEGALRIQLRDGDHAFMAGEFENALDVYTRVSGAAASASMDEIAAC